MSNKSTGATFPTVFAHVMSLCHILVVLTLFRTFSLLLYLTVTCDQCLQCAGSSHDGYHCLTKKEFLIKAWTFFLDTMLLYI